MAQNTNLNVSPYYDDFNRDKDFYRVLFRPGYSVQSRELTTLQSVLQEQIERFGNYQFKQGELVIPGEVGVNNKLNYVKLSAVSEVAVNVGGEIVYRKYDIRDLVGETLVGITSGVKAKLLEVKLESTTNSDTLFVSYITSGDSNTENTFRQGELLEVVNGVNTPILTVGTDGAVAPNFITITDVETGIIETKFSPALGFGFGVDIQEGVYFVNGFFVKNNKQLLVIDAYNNKPSAKIAFNINETIVTPEQDNSLYDNSRGSSNFSAPGSHRLKINLEATKYDYNELPDKNSIELISIKNGTVEKKIKQKEYNVLEETLARRTYDESGDYVVEEFPFNVREFYQTDSNTGLYSLNTESGLVNGIELSDAKQKLVGTVGQGKAYVKGYEIVNKETKYVTLDKSIDTVDRNNVLIKSKGASTFFVSNVYGSIPVNAEGVELEAYPTIYMFNTYNDGGIGLNGSQSNFRNTDNHRGELIIEGAEDQTGLVVNDLDPSDIGIKTIWVERSIDVLPTYDPTFLPTPGDFLYVIQSYTQVEGSAQPRTASAQKVRVLSTALVKNRKVNPGSQLDYAEITIAGRRDIVDTLFKESDLGDPQSRRRVFTVFEDAFDVNNIPVEDEQGQPIFPPLTRSNYYWGSIVDYTETISPLIGLCKPSNFNLRKFGDGFNPISDKILSKGVKNSEESYNSVFGLGYFSPIFFTRLKLTENITNGFKAGKYVTGTISGAFGVVEGTASGYYSSTNVLHVRVQSGIFLEGETVIDEDGNLIQIAKNNTISHFIVHNQGDQYDQLSKVIINGITYDRSKIAVNLSQDGVQIESLTIQDPSVRDVLYVNPPSVSVTNGLSSVITAVLYQETVKTYTPVDVKSFYSKYGLGSQGENIFTADVVSDVAEYSNFIKISDSTFSGLQGLNYLSVNTLSFNLAQVLREGDIIQYVQDDGDVVRAIVSYATNSTGNEKARVYLDSALRTDVSSTVLIKIQPKIDNPSASLIFKTGSKSVSSLVKDITDSKISYFFRRDFVSDGSSAGGSITFAARLPYGTQRFASFSKENYILTVLDPGIGDVVNFSKGDIVYIRDEYIDITNSSDTDSGLVAGSLTLSFPSNYFGENMTSYPKVKLTATLEVSKAKPKLKTSVENKRIIITSSNDKVIPLRGNDYDTGEVGIYSFSDVYKLRYVYEGSLVEPPKVDSSGKLISGKDVTNNFVFDDGQRPSYYDVSRLILKPGEQTPTGRLVVGFDYFEHSQGEFCTVDSYTHESGVSIENIPKYNTESGLVSLGDVLDFRPKVDSTVVTSGFQDTTVLTNTDYISFTGPEGVPSVSPANDSNLEYTFKFNESSYLSRIDALFVNKDGEFFIKKGNSSKNPSKPDLVEDSIPLYYVYLPALTDKSQDIKIIPVDNRRYTMRDIGKLEKRVERLEYYTALSILEQQALSMQIKDSLGFDRFKSGFIVDNFETHGVGDISSSEYVCAIDSQQSVLRPQVYEDDIKLIESNTREDERFFDGYVNKNNVVTLPYEEVSLLGNLSATTNINPNPFVVLQYVGDIQLHPTVDKWFDTDTIPLVTNNNTNLFNIYNVKSADPKSAIGSIYNSFLINWVGVSNSFATINSISSINTNEAESNTIESFVSSSSNVSPNNNETGKGLSTNSYDGVSVSSSVQFFARSIPVKFVVSRMKPNTRIYPFIDGRDISRWVCPDSTFTGIPTSSLGVFGGNLITDDSGNASGIILVPAGYPPIQGTTWTGNINDVQYDTLSEKINISSGKKTVKFTSSAVNAPKNEVETYSERTYYSTGVKPQNPPSIISTQPSYFKSNEGIQFVESNTDVKLKPNPLAQTFKIENFDGGVFVTGLDLYFNTKSTDIPIKVYLTDVNFGKPGKNIIPGTEKVLLPKTYLKVFTNGNITVEKGDALAGVSSGSSGVIEQILDRNGNEVALIGATNYNLTNEQVYTFILSNNNGIAFVQDEVLSSSSITSYNSTNNTNVQVKIAKDAGKIKKFVVQNVGSNYDGAVITVESPQLPGESQSSAIPYVSNGIIYDVEVALSGSGYTSAPSVIVKGIGDGANGAVITSVLEIDTPAVRMGVSSDDGTNIDSSTPTTFNFEYPVYLQNDSEYAIQVETDSTDYSLWSSKLGEVEKITGIKVSSQPLLGSLYKSQNTDTWVEDLFEDLKFELKRAKFDITKESTLTLVNDELTYKKLRLDPFETNSASNSNATSDLFKANNFIFKVYHRDHGFEDSGKSKVFFRGVDNFSAVSGNAFSTLYYEVDSVGVDTYTVRSISAAGDSARGGGSSVYAASNVKYEKLYADISNLQSPGTKINSKVKTVNVVPVDSNTTTYVSYQTSDFETTFLNQEQYFENQKFVCSRLNEVLNSTGKSLIYKLSLSSEVDYLSPVVDLRNISVKTSSIRVENSTGLEDRYGKRYQELKFWPVFTFVINGISGAPIANNQTLQGKSSGAEGRVVSVSGASVVVRMQNDGLFESGENLIFGDPSNAAYTDDPLVRIDTSDLISEIIPNFEINDGIVVYNSLSDIEYTNIIDGRIILWDRQGKTLTVNVEKKPIGNDYTSPNLPNSEFARASTLAAQSDDIFRVNDNVKFDGSLDGTENYLQVKETSFTSGIDYNSDLEITGTSAISKYITKQATISIPATSLDVRITANSKQESDIRVFYRTLEASNQEVLENIKWRELILDPIGTNFVRKDTISGVFELRNDYQELKYYVNDLAEFTKYQVKVVLRSDDPVFAPKVQDLRVVVSS